MFGSIALILEQSGQASLDKPLCFVPLDFGQQQLYM